MTTTDTIRSGVWTPWAEALCPDCHRTFTDAQAQRIHVQLDADDHLYHTPTHGICTANPGQDRRGCGAPIWLPPVATEAEAEANVLHLAMRWTMVRDTRVVESADPVNYAWVEGRLVGVIPNAANVEEVQP